MMIEVQITDKEAGKKVHRLVRQLLPGVPLSGIHKMIRTGRVKHNGKKAKPDALVAVGDVVRLYMAEQDFNQVSKPEKKFYGVSRSVDVIYEDHDMLVVNKPMGLLVHGAQGEQKETLVNRVLAYLYDAGELNSRVFTPAPVNRLDRNTSGLVVFGKTAEATKHLAEAFKLHEVRKWYLAIVKGNAPASGEITANLVRDERRNVTQVAEDGKGAHTVYVRKAATGQSSVVKVELISGRTHQIRAHFAHIRHPLWDDIKYGGKATRDEDRHQWLHAAWLRMTDGRVFHAPLPMEFVETLQKLGYTQQQIADMQQF